MVGISKDGESKEERKYISSRNSNAREKKKKRQRAREVVTPPPLRTSEDGVCDRELSPSQTAALSLTTTHLHRS